MKPEIIEKAYELDLDKISEGFLYSERLVWAENKNKAKSKMLELIKYEDMLLKFSGDQLTYLNIPIMRSSINDKVLFEGVEMSMMQAVRKNHERRRFEYLDKLLSDPKVEFCYIKKRGSYYAPNSSGYVDYKTQAGVYTKQESVRKAKSCDELTIVPINIEEHNAFLNKMIEDLKSRIIGNENFESSTINLPRSLTAENGMKSLLIGEFNETIEIPNEDYCGCGKCDYCIDFPDTEETITLKVPVEWSTIKEIYNKIVAHYSKQTVK